MNDQAHWAGVYKAKTPTQMSWYQGHPALSLGLIRESVIGPQAPIIDVGAGASTLVDHLLAAGYEDITALDISGEALQAARRRLDSSADRVMWIEGDVLEAALPKSYYSVWHDRAVFHFLSDPVSRRRYVAQVTRALRPGGHIIIATFAPDGPEMCSGLPVMRYDADSLHREFGDPFELVSSERETHITPWGTQQRFVYCRCRLRAHEAETPRRLGNL